MLLMYKIWLEIPYTTENNKDNTRVVKSIINNIQTYLLSTTEIKKHTYRVLQLVIRAYFFLKTNLIEAIIEYALPNIINLPKV